MVEVPGAPASLSHTYTHSAHSHAPPASPLRVWRRMNEEDRVLFVRCGAGSWVSEDPPQARPPRLRPSVSSSTAGQHHQVPLSVSTPMDLWKSFRGNTARVILVPKQWK